MNNVDLQDYLKPIQNKEVTIPADLEGNEMVIYGNVISKMATDGHLGMVEVVACNPCVSRHFL